MVVESAMAHAANDIKNPGGCPVICVGVVAKSNVLSTLTVGCHVR